MIKDILAWIGIIIMWAAIVVATVGPMLNHIVYCFKSGEYVLLLAGVIVAPVGWFHGLGLLFGWW